MIQKFCCFPEGIFAEMGTAETLVRAFQIIPGYFVLNDMCVCVNGWHMLLQIAASRFVDRWSGRVGECILG